MSVLNRFMALVGVLVGGIGMVVWIGGSASYSTCQNVNALVGGGHCSPAREHLGLVLVIVGVSLVVLAGVLAFARAATPASGSKKSA